jgi:hypothetical protein
MASRGYDLRMILHTTSRKPLVVTAVIVVMTITAWMVGCKKKAPPPPPPKPAWMQTTPSPPEPGTDESDPTPAPQIDKETAWVLGEDASTEKPDAAVRQVRPGPKGIKPGERYATDADIAAFEAKKALAATEKAATNTLNSTAPQLKSCFERHGTGTVNATVSIRVHRSGHVMTSSVSGVNDAVRNCVQNILNDLKVDGVQTDSVTVQRTFKFKKIVR